MLNFIKTFIAVFASLKKCFFYVHWIVNVVLTHKFSSHTGIITPGPTRGLRKDCLNALEPWRAGGQERKGRK